MESVGGSDVDHFLKVSSGQKKKLTVVLVPSVTDTKELPKKACRRLRELRIRVAWPLYVAASLCHMISEVIRERLPPV